MDGLVSWAWLVGRGECCFLVFGVFGTGILKCVPQNVAVVQVGIWGDDDAISQGVLFEMSADYVASCVG